MNKTVFIYALREVGTDEYRYVGKSNKPKKRLYHHIRNSVKLKTYKHKWIQSVLKKGSNIECKFIYYLCIFHFYFLFSLPTIINYNF